jgi:hypothetical protein
MTFRLSQLLWADWRYFGVVGRNLLIPNQSAEGVILLRRHGGDIVCLAKSQMKFRKSP